jgi:heat-inducible transcriptional repressor
MLKSRTGTVLKILVNEYISSAVPIASEDIARRSPWKISPATIRMEMAELEGEGYILRPHVSAGGVPSDKVHRFVVESRDDCPDLPDTVQREIRNHFNGAPRDQEAWIQITAGVLSRMVHNMAIVTLPRATYSRLKQVQLVYLQEFLALMIVVLEQPRLRQQLLPLEELHTQEELTEVANKLNDSLAGLTHSQMLAKHMELTPLEGLVMDQTVATLRELDTESALEHCVDGLRLLLSQPEFDETRRARNVVEILEERVLLKSILSEVPQQGSVGVFIGEENPEEPLRPFSVILSRYGIPEEASGTIGVIGPTRMEYGSAIGGVRYLSSLLSDLVMGVHRRP